MHFPVKGHPYHIVTPSPWPILTAFSVFVVMLEILAILYNEERSANYLFLAIIIFALTVVRWGSDINYEGGVEGHHTKRVQDSLTLGFALFILSEVMFFGALFGSYFYIMTHTSVALGYEWPPLFLYEMYPLNFPLANAFLLVISGVWGELAHHYIDEGDSQTASHYLMGLMIMGLMFVGVQLNEYLHSPFGMDDGIFGSLFFFITGFHGLHVCFGLLFVYVQYYRILSGKITSKHHLGLDFSILYWHFVDVIWIIVFLVLYLHPTL